MGHQIIIQPDGKLAVFSSVVDSWILYDATPDELIAYYLDLEIEISKRVFDVVNGTARKTQFSLTFEKADEISKRTTGQTLEEMRAEHDAEKQNESRTQD